MLVHLPDELLASIADHVDSRLDLLSLALTCTSFCRVIVPARLYRSIAVSITNPEYLVRISADPSLVVHVREVILVNTAGFFPAKLRYKEWAPELSWSRNAALSERTLSNMKAALSQFPRLSSLVLSSGTQGPFCMSEEAVNVLLENHVERLEHVCLDITQFSASSSFLLWQARDLRTLELDVSSIYRLAWNSLVDVLANSPQLQVLGLPSILHSPKFLSGGLPAIPPLPYLSHLRALSTPAIFADPAVERHIFDFLHAHPLLADLRWMSPALPAAAGMPPLARLRRLRDGNGAAGAAFAARLLDGKPPGSVRLVTLECYRESALSATALRALDPAALRAVCMQDGTFADVRALARAFPHIAHLELPRAPIVGARMREFARLADVAALFPALRVVRNVDPGCAALAPLPPLPPRGGFAEVSSALRAIRVVFPEPEDVNGWRLDDWIGERVVHVVRAATQQFASMAPVHTRFVLREGGYSVGYTEPSLESI